MKLNAQIPAYMLSLKARNSAMLPAEAFCQWMVALEEVGHVLVLDNEGKYWAAPQYADTNRPEGPFEGESINLIENLICAGAGFGEDVTFLEACRKYIPFPFYTRLMEKVIAFHSSGTFRESVWEEEHVEAMQKVYKFNEAMPDSSTFRS